MGTGIVQTSEFVTLAGAGPVNAEILEDALRLAPFLIGVDGGAQLSRNYGKEPNYVVGDLDSVEPAFLQSFPKDRVIETPDQNYSDIEKALAVVAAPLIVGVGFLGGRADHQMGALYAVAGHRDVPVVLLNEHDVVFRLPGRIRLDVDPGTRISLYPVTEARVDCAGLRWPLKDVAMSATGLISQSNEAAAPQVDLHAMGRVLAFLPRQALAAVVAALTRSRQTT